MKKKHKLWFKRRRYGYGWTPVTLEGWTLTIIFIFSLLMTSKIFLKEDDAEPPFIPILILLIGIFISITYKKSPKPKWRWGKKTEDDPELDY